MAPMSRDVSILNLELSSESDEVKRLYKSYMLLTQCVERLDRIIGMKYGITVRLGTGTATLIANMQNDFADASSLVFTAEKELRASIEDEENLKKEVAEHGGKATTPVEKAAMGYANLHKRKLTPVVEGIPAITIELEKAVHIPDLNALKERAMEIKKNLMPAKNQVKDVFREVRIIFKVSKKNAEKATSRGIFGGMKSILGLR